VPSEAKQGLQGKEIIIELVKLVKAKKGKIKETGSQNTQDSGMDQ
jgi:hypothetical protein